MSRRASGETRAVMGVIGLVGAVGVASSISPSLDAFLSRTVGTVAAVVVAGFVVVGVARWLWDLILEQRELSRPLPPQRTRQIPTHVDGGDRDA